MKIVHIGVGEAFDANLGNNSHLVDSDTKLLLDCGYSIPPRIWRYEKSQAFLDAVYISHFHADHYFGVPALLTRMYEEKRAKPLKIICQDKVPVITLFEMAYKGIWEKLPFNVEFIEVVENSNVTINELELSFAMTVHSEKNLAIRVSDGNRVFCYSGDGDITPQSRLLYKGADIVIHEALSMQKQPNHCSIPDVLTLKDVNCLMLTHIKRDERKKVIETLGDSVFIPEPV